MKRKAIKGLRGPTSPSPADEACFQGRCWKTRLCSLPLNKRRNCIQTEKTGVDMGDGWRIKGFSCRQNNLNLEQFSVAPSWINTMRSMIPEGSDKPRDPFGTSPARQRASCPAGTCGCVLQAVWTPVQRGLGGARKNPKWFYSQWEVQLVMPVWDKKLFSGRLLPSIASRPSRCGFSRKRGGDAGEPWLAISTPPHRVARRSWGCTAFYPVFGSKPWALLGAGSASHRRQPRLLCTACHWKHQKQLA